MFGKSMEDQVNGALDKVRAKFPGAKISASVKDKVVTLKGEAPDLGTKQKIMAEFNALVKTENTINQIAIPKPAAAGPQAAGAAPGNVTAGAAGAKLQVHEVVKGDTLSAIAKKYYGKASAYNRIFEANRDILDNPDKIKVGQKLKIPM